MKYKYSRWILLVGAGLAASLQFQNQTVRRTSSAEPHVERMREPVEVSKPVVGSEPEESAPQVAPVEPLQAVANDVTRDKQTPHVPDMAKFESFDNWVEQWQKADPETRAAMTEKGVELTRQRREVMRELIATNPEQAIKMAIPYEVRSELPQRIVEQLETPINDVGSYYVSAITAAPGAVLDGPAIQRSAEVGGETYRVNAYGKGLQRPTRQNVPLHGVALDDQLALNEKPYRRMTRSEVDYRKSKGQLDTVCATSGKPAGQGEVPPAADIGGRLLVTCQEAHLADELSKSWAAAGGGSSGDGQIAESPSTGNRTFLYMRVRFSDQGDANWEPQTLASAQQQAANSNTFLTNASFGAHSLAVTIPPTFTLPNTEAWYNQNGGWTKVLDDARAAANAAGYNPANYDDDGVRYNNGPGAFGGVAWVGGKGLVVKFDGQGLFCHEYGHNMGLYHANYWATSDGTAIGAGANQGYGDDFDILGNSGAGMKGHYNVNFKSQLGWLPTANVHAAASAAGSKNTYRVYANDLGGTLNGLQYAIKIAKDADREYWVGYRQHADWGSNGITKGATLHWDPWANSSGGSQLIDTTPGSAGGKNDCTIVPGRTFSDTAADIHFTVTQKVDAAGGNPPALDVVVAKGPFAGNQAPEVNIVSNPANPAVGQQVTLTANANDPDGDILAYQWDTGDGVLYASTAVITTTWTTGGVKAVKCTVSDMKGLVDTETLNVQVGSAPPTASGVWTNAAGGSWATAANWSNGSVASGVGSSADFSTLNLAGNAAVALDGDRIIGNLVYGDTTPSHNWTLNAGTGGSLTLDVASGTPTITVNNQTSTIGVPLSGSEGMRKNGAGTLVLTASNGYTGATSIDAGTLIFSSGNTDLTLPTGTKTIASGATMKEDFSPQTTQYRRTNLGATVINSGGVLELYGTADNVNSHYLINAWTATGAGTIKVTGGGSISNWTGSSNALSGFTGLIDIQNGRFAANITSASTLGGNFDVNIAATGKLDLRSGHFTIDALNGVAGSLIHKSWTGDTVTFTIGSGNSSGNFAGVMQDTNYNVVKTGTGTQTLSGANTYTGTTTVSGGTLQVNGSLAGGAVTVASGGTLAGTGMLGGATTVQSGATLAPGAGGIGTLTVNNTLALSGTTAMQVSRAGASLTSDRVSGASTVTYGGALTVTSAGPDALAAGNSFQLFSAGAYGGTFTAVNLPALGGGMSWDTSKLAVNGTISILAPPLPPGWTSADVGAVGVAGSTSVSNGTYTVSGSGEDIWNSSDSFQFASQTLVGDGEIRARVTSQTNTNGWAKAGVMIRNGTAADAAHAMMVITPGNGFSFQSRSTAGGTSSFAAGPALNATPNNWVRLTRSGTLITAYASANGTAWTKIGTLNITMASSVSVGLAVTSHDNTVLSTATFDNVSVTPFPAPWVTTDIGATGLPGSAEYFASAYTVNGAGTVGGASDKFRFVYQMLSGDGQITARIKAPGNTGRDARIGVMIRDTLSIDSPFAFMGVDGGSNFYWHRRRNIGSGHNSTAGGAGTAPDLWVRVVRTGNMFRGYKSTDGVNWSIVNSLGITMGTNIYVGLAVSSGGTATLNSSVMDNVTVTP